MTSPMRTAIKLLNMPKWFGGDIKEVVDLVRIADRKGVYQVDMSEHLVMGEDTSGYPYGTYPMPLDAPWYEPISMLSAIAAVTDRIRLSTGVLVSPLRPVGLLAKQLATLHLLSRGRVDIGLGVGWQEAEYVACGIPFEDRFNRMEEQVRACRELWSHAPASFHGKHVNFDGLYSYPLIPDQSALRIWFGVGDSAANVRRMAELGDGWIAMSNDPATLAPSISKFKAAFEEHGRDPASFEVRVTIQPVYDAAGVLDWGATLAPVPALKSAGVTVICIYPYAFCRGPSEFEAIIDQLVQI